MGPLQNLVGMMPDLPQGANPEDIDESQLRELKQ